VNYSTSPPILQDDLPGFDAGKSGSKKVTKRRRRSAAKDRKAIAITRVSGPASPTASIVPLVPNPTHTFSPSNDNQEASTDTLSVTPLSGVIKSTQKSEKAPAWEHTTDLAKVTAANRAVYGQGLGYAWTLNLGPKEIAVANDNAKGFADYFKRRISRALRPLLGPDAIYGFAVGVAAGRLHLHGSIEANDNIAAAVRRALEHAGGEWVAPHGKQYQCDLQPMYNPDVWTGYCLRDQAKVKRLIRGKAISITTPLRRRARELWSSHV
jgi:hypothetical protein